MLPIIPRNAFFFYDDNGDRNTLLSTSSHIRVLLLNNHYDEVDLKRSHISNVIGCWTRANPTTPLPDVILRFLDPAQRDALEEDISNELSQASTRLTTSIRAAEARGDHRELSALRTQLSKTRCRPKDVYSCADSVELATTMFPHPHPPVTPHQPLRGPSSLHRSRHDPLQHLRPNPRVERTPNFPLPGTRGSPPACHRAWRARPFPPHGCADGVADAGGFSRGVAKEANMGGAGARGGFVEGIKGANRRETCGEVRRVEVLAPLPPRHRPSPP